MKQASIVTILALMIQATISPFAAQAGSDNSFGGLIAVPLFSATSFYASITASIASLTAIASSVDVTTTQSLYTILSNFVTTFANNEINLFMSLSNDANTWNQFYSTVKNSDDNYKRKYAFWNATLNNLTTINPLLTQFKLTQPNITAANGLVANMTVLDLYIFNNLTMLINNVFGYEVKTNQTLAQLTSLNSQLALNLALDENNSNNLLLQNFQNLQLPIGPVVNQLILQVNQFSSYMQNYTLGVLAYLNSIVQGGISNIQNYNGQVNSISGQINNFGSAFSQNISILGNTLIVNLNNMVNANVSELNAIFGQQLTNYNSLWAQVNTLNGIIQGVSNNLPLFNQNLNWGNQLLNWAMSKVNYDFTNIMNYQLMYTNAINNIFQSFDSMIVAENHFNDNILAGPVRSFALYSATYVYGTWTPSVSANFPNGLTNDQAQRLTVWTTDVLIFDSVITSANITRVTLQNFDINYAFEGHLGYVIDSTGIHAYVAVSDPIASSGLLQINVEVGFANTAPYTNTPSSVNIYGTAASNGNFSPFFTQVVMGPNGQTAFDQSVINSFMVQMEVSSLNTEVTPAILEDIDEEEAISV